jgi:hypothetical protein
MIVLLDDVGTTPKRSYEKTAMRGSSVSWPRRRRRPSTRVMVKELKNETVEDVDANCERILE